MILARNPLVGNPLHRVDLRVLRHFPFGGRAKVDGIFEVFNLFNQDRRVGDTARSVSERLWGPHDNLPHVSGSTAAVRQQQGIV